MSPALLLLFTLRLTAATDDDAGVTTDDSGLLARGRAAYDDVRLRDAAILFREAAEAAATAEERTLALVWAGVAAGQAGELAIARRAFDDALRVRCHGTLPTTVSPKVAAVFREALVAAWPRGCPALPPPNPPAPREPLTVRPPPPPPTATSAATSTVVPGPAPASSATTDSGLPSPLGLTLVGVGGAAVAVAIGVSLKGAADIVTAADPRTVQLEAQARLDDGNLALGVASGVGAVGVAALIGGVVTLMLPGADP